MRITLLATLAASAIACGGCAERDDTDTGPDATHIVDVFARGLAFAAPAEIPSGWTTFRLNNESAMVHFALVERLPDGIGIEDQQALVAPIFQRGMDLLNAGETDAAMEKFAELPDWFGGIVFLGGPGLVSPGRSAQATMHLEPGTYLLECYVKTNGVFHSYPPSPPAYGMVHQFTVTQAASAAPEPSASLHITLSSGRGIEADTTVAAGEHTVAVHFEDQKPHENFVGHDVHVVRLEPDTDVAALAAWMDWSAPTGLETPAPAVFVGGTNEMPPGATAYFTLDLVPGRYAWIAEVTNPAQKGMLKIFNVASDAAGADPDPAAQ